MKILEYELRRIYLPLVRPFRTSFTTQTDREVLLIKVTTEDGIVGWSECVAMSAQTADEGTDMDVDSEGRGGAAAAESSPPTLPAVLVRPTAPIEDVMAMPVDAAPQPQAWTANPPSRRRSGRSMP